MFLLGFGIHSTSETVCMTWGGFLVLVQLVLLLLFPRFWHRKLEQVAKRAPQWLSLHKELTAELGVNDAAGVV